MSQISDNIAIILIVSSVFGGGVFLIVECFGPGGILGSILIFTFVFLPNLVSIFYCVESVQHEKKKILDKLKSLELEGGEEEKKKKFIEEYSNFKYGDILKVVHPVWGVRVCSIFMIIGCYGATFCYFNLLVSLGNAIFGCMFEIEPVVLRTYISLILGLILGVLLLFRTHKELSYVSFFTVGCIVFIVVYLSILYANFGSYFATFQPALFVYDGNIFKSISIMIFLFSCHQNVISVLVSMKNTDRNNQIKVSFIGLLIPFILYILIGCLGYLNLGKIDSSFLNVLINRNGMYLPNYKLKSTLDPNAYFIYFSTILSSLVLLFAVPIQSFEARKGLFEFIGKDKILQNIYFIPITAIHWILLLLIGISGWDTSIIMGLLGSIIEPAFCYIFPALAYFIIQKKEKKLAVSAILMIVISTVIAITSFVSITGELVAKFTDKNANNGKDFNLSCGNRTFVQI